MERLTVARYRWKDEIQIDVHIGSSWCVDEQLLCDIGREVVAELEGEENRHDRDADNGNCEQTRSFLGYLLRLCRGASTCCSFICLDAEVFKCFGVGVEAPQFLDEVRGAHLTDSSPVSASRGDLSGRHPRRLPPAQVTSITAHCTVADWFGR